MDKREQIARMAQTKEDEMLLAKIYERMTNAAARNIPAATGFLSKHIYARGALSSRSNACLI